MPNLIICDANPLILLAKTDCLDLIEKILDVEIIVLQVIVDEVCSDSARDGSLMIGAEFWQENGWAGK